ncbi:V-type ATP synthase subunit I [Clostridium sp.]|uniref:V-type ATP synthase subunit I n=1 Tax=Clostridium sp. TaxID=1506 RepID=UPI0034647119
MAIVKMSKFTLLAFKSQKEELLERLQRFERVQFIDLKENEEEELTFLTFSRNGEGLSKIQGDLAKINFSLDMLKDYAQKEGALEALKKGKTTLSYGELQKRVNTIPWENIYEDLKKRDNDLNSIKNELSKIHSEIEVLSPWANLDVSFGDLKSLNHCGYFIGTIPKMFKDRFLEDFNSNVKNSYIELLNEIKGETYILAIVHKDKEEKALEILKASSFSKVNISYDEKPIDIINSFNNKVKNLRIEENNIKEELRKEAINIENLKIVYEYLSNKEMVAGASDNFLNSDNLVVIKGWIPSEDKKNLEYNIKAITKENYYLDVKDAEHNDPDVPVLLKNNRVVSAFESITSMFSVPRYNEIDPTPLLTPFYLVFFGMMLADAGYGLVMFIAAFYALKKFKLDEKQEGFVRFFMYLSIPTAIAGIIYGSYFGDILAGVIPVKGLVNPGEDVMIVMIAAIVLGLIQIYTGLGIKAYMIIREGRRIGDIKGAIKDAIYDAGSWYLALTGGLVLIAGGALGLSPSVVSIFKWMMIIGMVMIVLTQGRENKGVGAKLGAGLYALYGISGYVGDLVSYSRLMALGLAGGFIGSAFNLMVGMIGNPIAKIIAGTLIFVLGHLFNLLLSALGAYVHTCRLQYVEYFSKFYEGGGKAFTPFKAKNKYINLKKEN